MSASGDLGYWVGLQHANVRMEGHDDPVEMHLRVTEIYRHEDDTWKLIHRHADPHTSPITRLAWIHRLGWRRGRVVTTECPSAAGESILSRDQFTAPGGHPLDASLSRLVDRLR